MTTRICAIYWIIIAICVKVKTSEGFRVKVLYVVCVDKSSGFGVVVAAIQIVKTGFGIVVIATVTEGVNITYKACVGVDVTACILNRDYSSPGIVNIFCN